MTNALDQTARSGLERFIQRARRLLEDDLARHAEGRFGIHATDGTIEDEDGLHLSPEELATRRDIVDILHFIRREEPDHPAAVSRLIREAAFTHLNRLVAVRIAEAIGLLPESIAKGTASAGYRELLEVAPLLAHDASGGYWRYLQLCGDELAADLPQLFDPRNPLLELSPSPAAFDELVDLLTAAELTPVWNAPDALGWAYQFFNSGDERRAMRDASPSPRNSRELAVRNQFFTPRYVVDFLVHNSLGRRLLDADPTSPLIDDLPLLLDAPTEPGEPLDLAEVRVLDPACGSGHFLLGAYDVLEHAWRHAGVEPEDAAPRIVASLWGIDIDPRCAQVAAAAIILRARRACPRHDLPTPNVICARALPEPAGGWESLLASLADDRRQLVAAMRDALARAPLLGPLLKVEEHLATEIRARVAGADDTDGTLFASAGVANDAFGHAEADVLAVLRQVADQTTSTPAERVFAAEADDAIRFVEALRHRYDTVLMNPPFGEPVAATKDYLKAAYPWIPARDYNLLAAFIGRGLELCNTNGLTGAITSRTCMFLKTFEEFRNQVMLGSHLRCVADIGYGVMEQALVEAAAYVISAGRTGEADTGTFVRLLKDADPEAALLESISDYRLGRTGSRVFRVMKKDFQAIPGAPLAYWVGDSVRSLFRTFPAIEGSIAEFRVGLQTGDDFRFVRLRWEVVPKRIAHSAEEANLGKRWVTYAKGGDYSPFWSDIHLLVDWSDGGKVLADFPGSVIRNSQYFFAPGLTWTRRTASGFGPRVLQSGCIFGDQGPAAVGIQLDPNELLGWLTSRLIQSVLDAMVAAGDEVMSGGAARTYQVGLVQSLPWPGSRPASSRVGEEVARVVAERRESDRYDEMTGSFVVPALPASHQRFADAVIARLTADEDRALAILDRTAACDDQIADAVELDAAGRRYLDEEIGPHPSTYPESAGDTERFARLYRQRIEDTIDELIVERGGSRAIANLTYFADRRLEVLAHGLQVSPAALVGERRRQGLLPPEEPARTAGDVLSYLVGVAFGRWDVRFALKPATQPALGDPFDPRPVCPPGMLVGADGLPSDAAPAGYPVQFPVNGILLDEHGHSSDIVAAVIRVATLVVDNPEQLLGDVMAALGSMALRPHLRSKYFKEHLSRYSKSRRKAPIYWPLYVPSGKWGIWVYAPRLRRETLYVVASEALRREGHAELEMERLERERASGGGRGPKALDKALDDERKLAEELRRFRQEAERIAGLGWEPDLDDGIVLCAAPLADLFLQWRRELAGYREELRAGKYEWSTVSKWAGEL